MKIRTFIAIPLEENTKEQIMRFQDELKKHIEKGIKWVESQSLHVTLKFLGDIEDSEVEPIANLMKKLVENQHSFKFTIKGLGAFPNLRRPNVIWIGLEGSREIFQSLYTKLDEELSQLGINPENKEFSPHITLGRIKRDVEIGENWSKVISQYHDITFGEVEAKSIVFFKSDLQPKGPIYTPLSEVFFKKETT